MASCRKWILNIHSFTIWIKNEQLPVDHTFWWPILRNKFHEIFTLVWEAISKTRASGFIRRSKHLETIKALGRSRLVLSSVSRCLEPLIKPSHSLLIYYVKLRILAHSRRFLANQKARNAIVGAENLLMVDIFMKCTFLSFLMLRRQRSRDQNGPKFNIRSKSFLEPFSKNIFKRSCSLINRVLINGHDYFFPEKVRQ